MNSALEPLSNSLLEDTGELPTAKAVLDAFARYQTETEERLSQCLDRIPGEEEPPAAAGEDPGATDRDDPPPDPEDHDEPSLDPEGSVGEETGDPVQEPERSEDIEASPEAEDSGEAEDPVDPQGDAGGEDQALATDAAVEYPGADPVDAAELEGTGDAEEPSLMAGSGSPEADAKDDEDPSGKEKSPRGSVRRRRRSGRKR